MRDTNEGTLCHKMQFYQDERGKSDNACSSCSRCKSDNNFTTMLCKPVTGNSSSSEIYCQALHDDCDINPSYKMPQHSYHSHCIPNRPFETPKKSQKPQFRCQVPNCAWGTPLTCLESPVFPYTNNRPTNGLSFATNNTGPPRPMNPTAVSPFTIESDTAYTAHNMPCSFASNTKRGAQLQNTYLPAASQRDVSSRVSVTPQLSYVTTPESILSAPIGATRAQDKPGQYETPSPSMTSINACQNMQAMTPTYTRQTMSGDIQEARKLSFNPYWLSDHNSNNQDWLAAYDFDSALSSTQPASISSNGQTLTTLNPEIDSTSLFLPNDTSFTSIGDVKYDPVSELNEVDPILGDTFLSFPPSTDRSGYDAFGTDNDFSSCEQKHIHSSQPFTSTQFPDHFFDFGQSQNVDENMSDFRQSPNIPGSNAVEPSNAMVFDRGHQKTAIRSRQNTRNNEMDKKLVEWRNAGMSYKEIMAKGDFGLEESTLRGRYRTLTKSKDKRLRKPCWPEHAVSTRNHRPLS